MIGGNAASDMHRIRQPKYEAVLILEGQPLLELAWNVGFHMTYGQGGMVRKGIP